MGLVQVSTDSGITGYSDMETSASVAKAAVEAPSWSEEGMEFFEGLASLIEQSVLLTGSVRASSR